MVMIMVGEMLGTYRHRLPLLPPLLLLLLLQLPPLSYTSPAKVITVCEGGRPCTTVFAGCGSTRCSSNSTPTTTTTKCTTCICPQGCDHGSCTSPSTCTCDVGWSGPSCSTPECLPGCHKDHGSCLKPGECRCDVGWWGDKCDLCFPYPGCKHGSCDRPWQCKCKPGWTGELCDTPVSLSRLRQSQAEAVPRSGQNDNTETPAGEKEPVGVRRTADETTTRREEMTETVTETGVLLDGCESIEYPCLNGGTCLNSTCVCPPPFTGRVCDYLAPRPPRLLRLPLRIPEGVGGRRNAKRRQDGGRAPGRQDETVGEGRGRGETENTRRRQDGGRPFARQELDGEIETATRRRQDGGRVGRQHEETGGRDEEEKNRRTIEVRREKTVQERRREGKVTTGERGQENWKRTIALRREEKNVQEKVIEERRGGLEEREEAGGELGRWKEVEEEPRPQGRKVEGSRLEGLRRRRVRKKEGRETSDKQQQQKQPNDTTNISSVDGTQSNYNIQTGSQDHNNNNKSNAEQNPKSQTQEEQDEEDWKAERRRLLQKYARITFRQPKPGGEEDNEASKPIAHAKRRLLPLPVILTRPAPQVTIDTLSARDDNTNDNQNKTQSTHDESRPSQVGRNGDEAIEDGGRGREEGLRGVGRNEGLTRGVGDEKGRRVRLEGVGGSGRGDVETRGSTPGSQVDAEDTSLKDPSKTPTPNTYSLQDPRRPPRIVQVISAHHQPILVSAHPRALPSHSSLSSTSSTSSTSSSSSFSSSSSSTSSSSSSSSSSTHPPPSLHAHHTTPFSPLKITATGHPDRDADEGKQELRARIRIVTPSPSAFHRLGPPVRISLPPAQITPKPAQITAKPPKGTPKPVQVAPEPIQVTARPTQLTPKPAQITPTQDVQILPTPARLVANPAHFPAQQLQIPPTPTLGTPTAFRSVVPAHTTPNNPFRSPNPAHNKHPFSPAHNQRVFPAHRLLLAHQNSITPPTTARPTHFFARNSQVTPVPAYSPAQRFHTAHESVLAPTSSQRNRPVSIHAQSSPNLPTFPPSFYQNTPNFQPNPPQHPRPTPAPQALTPNLPVPSVRSFTRPTVTPTPILWSRADRAVFPLHAQGEGGTENSAWVDLRTGVEGGAGFEAETRGNAGTNFGIDRRRDDELGTELGTGIASGIDRGTGDKIGSGLGAGVRSGVDSSIDRWTGDRIGREFDTRTDFSTGRRKMTGLGYDIGTTSGGTGIDSGTYTGTGRGAWAVVRTGNEARATGPSGSVATTGIHVSLTEGTSTGGQLRHGNYVHRQMGSGTGPRVKTHIGEESRIHTVGIHRGGGVVDSSSSMVVGLGEQQGTVGSRVLTTGLSEKQGVGSASRAVLVGIQQQQQTQWDRRGYNTDRKVIETLNLQGGRDREVELVDKSGGSEVDIISTRSRSSSSNVKDPPESYYEEHSSGSVHIGDVSIVDDEAPHKEIFDAFIELKKV